MGILIGSVSEVVILKKVVPGFELAKKNLSSMEK